MDRFSHSIPYMKHQIIDEDIESVIKAMRSDFLTQGPIVEALEEKMAKLSNRKFAVMCSNGTAALHLVAEMITKKNSKQNIITTSFTFVADANFGRFINAEIRFADIDPNMWTISPESVEKLIDENTIAVVAPHYAGLSCDMDSISSICSEKNILLVEDACHAPTALHNNKTVGSLGDISTFSFHATKHIGAGEGGAVCTDNQEVYEKLQLLRSHGLPHWSKRTGFGYDIDEMAFNYRPNEISAALALSHIKRLDLLINKRVNIAKKYDGSLDWDYFTKQIIPKNSTHVYHLYPILVKHPEDRDRCIQYLRDLNIFVQIHYPSINEMKGFKDYAGETPLASNISSRVISIPMFPQLENSEQEFVIKALNNFSKSN